MSITPISSITPAFGDNSPFSIDAAHKTAGVGVPAPSTSATDKTTPTRSFGQMLGDAIAEVNQAQLHASDLTARMAAGEPLDVHQVMIASQEASIALNLALQTRNKLMEAYTEIMHTAV